MGRGGSSAAPGRRRGSARPGVALLAVVAVGASASLATPAGAVSRLVVTGAGFGHGVGLSQYGARGMALRGASPARILRHYYRGTALTRSAAADRRVRVALAWGRREATVSGAVSIGGLRTKTGRSYRLVRKGSGVEIRQLGRRKPLGRSSSGVQVVPGRTTLLRVAGRSADGVQDGSFRGTIDVLPDGAGVLVVNDLHIEEYLRGVVTEESPSSWPAAALQAQAIVARTYAITNAVGGRAFDQWPDTRSQVYTGVAGETGPGDAAIAATRGRVVTLGGTPVITYFFSTSGGRTEDSSAVFGGPSRSWLQSVRDPYEPGSPLRRWTRTFSDASADARTRRFGVGELRRIEVLRRGDSPRVVRARVVGSGGAKEVTGEQLQLAFDLPDRWATFATVAMSGCLDPGPTPAERRAAAERRRLRAVRADQRRRAAGPAVVRAGHGVGVVVAFTAGGDEDADAPLATLAAGAARPTTSTAPAAPAPAPGAPAEVLAAAARDADRIAATRTADNGARPARAARCRLVGGVRPAPRGAAGRLQRREDGGWRTVRRVALRRDGRFDTVVPKRGTWRVRVGRVSTPTAGLQSTPR